jgi:hypothetical protein
MRNVGKKLVSILLSCVLTLTFVPVFSFPVMAASTLAVTITGDNVFFAGDIPDPITLTAEVSGGSGNYAYRWQIWNGSAWVYLAADPIHSPNTT